MDNFVLTMLGILVVWLGISAALYAFLYRRFGLRIERSWKRAAFQLGCSAVLSPGMLLGLGHGIPPPFPAGLAVLVMLMAPRRFDHYFEGMAFNLICWAITIATFAVIARLLRRPATSGP